MIEVVKSVLVGYSAAQMFALVDAVEDYPGFLPWCAATDVLARDAQITRATIHINYRGVRQSFTTENKKSAPSFMHIQLIQGPFKALDGAWRFNELSDSACKIELSLHYEFSSRVLGKLMGPVFGYIANTLVDAFVKRAERVYGSR